ncbi:MAG: hypothetical protein Q9187_000065 [Circinaria calcarea]
MPYTLKEFESVFPSLVQDLTEHAQQYGMPSNALQWYQKVQLPSYASQSYHDVDRCIQSLKHNTLGGKCNRGISVLDTASILLSAPLSPSQFHAVSTLGWLTELLQAFFLVSDDIMDSSHTRRGQPCWYRVSEVGMIAINDAFMLESSIYVLLKRHFREHPAYIDIVELFHETSLQTEIGQTCDLLTAPEDVVDLSNFSMDKFQFIVIHKTAYYSFYLPVALALHYLQRATPSNLKQARDILIPLGEYFQAQDDFLDVYGSPEMIGKIGTDIQDNKCSWVINQALQRASTSQRKTLDENYGRKDDQKEAKVKEVFADLKLEEIYRDYEEKRVAEIRAMIDKVDESEGLIKEVFESFLKKIYKRSK